MHAPLMLPMDSIVFTCTLSTQSTLQQRHVNVQTVSAQEGSSSGSDITITTDTSYDPQDTGDKITCVCVRAYKCSHFSLDHPHHDDGIRNALEELQELSACLINSNNN